MELSDGNEYIDCMEDHPFVMVFRIIVFTKAQM